jgi:hypothetical protein
VVVWLFVLVIVEGGERGRGVVVSAVCWDWDRVFHHTQRGQALNPHYTSHVTIIQPSPPNSPFIQRHTTEHSLNPTIPPIHQRTQHAPAISSHACYFAHPDVAYFLVRLLHRLDDSSNGAVAMEVGVEMDVEAEAEVMRI